VVQQRGGVQLKGPAGGGGRDEPGDA
jgi:hypothetical protein